MKQFDSSFGSFDAINLHDLENVTGGGKWSKLWEGVKKVGKVIAGTGPFGVAAYQIHNIWSRATD
jgi:hypothetical protein